MIDGLMDGMIAFFFFWIALRWSDKSECWFFFFFHLRLYVYMCN
jgi:hypothetical protein